ncbi:hypothetical protein [uncultured Sphingomonas sp.]|uniref:hypothetical protein n=1 Tax=uncultured Sphingomonas sp. TaxID=158754 RepID=UPI0035CB4EC5
MSHIPASRMPHAHAQDERIDDQPAQPGQAQPAPEPTTTVPPASASGASPTGGDRAADAGSGSDKADTPVNGPSARDEKHQSSLPIAAMVVGGLAVVGGLVAALLPLLTPKDEPKSKKRKRRKHA